MVVGNIQEESLRYAVAKYLDAISGLVGLIIFTNILSAAEIGLYFTGVAVFMIGSAGSRGLYDGVKKRGSEKDTDLSKFYSIALVGSFVYVLVMILISTIGFFVLKQGYLPITYEIPIALLYGVILRFISSSIFRSLVTAYDGNGDIAMGGYYNLLRGILETILQVSFLILISPNILYLFVGSAVSTFIICAMMRKNLSQIKFKRFTISDVRSIKQFGLWNSLSSICITVEHRLITVILALINPAIAGIYGVVLRTTKPALYVPDSLSRTLFIETSFRKSNEESIEEKLPIATKYATILAIPMLFGSIGLSDQILTVFYSEEFAKGGLILISMSIAMVLRSQAYVLSGYLYGSDMAKTVTKSTIINLVSSLSILIIGVQIIGVNALLISLVVSRVLYLSYLYISVNKICDFYFHKDLIYQFIASGLMLLLIYVQKHIFDMNTYLIVLFIGINAVFYFVILMTIDNEFYNKILNRYQEYMS